MRKLRNAEIDRPGLDEIAKIKRLPVVVVLDNIRSIWNVGSMFRTSDAFLVEKLYLCGITATPEQSTMQKTALGAQDTVPWEYVPESSSVVKKLKTEGYKIAVLEITDSPTLLSELSDSDYPLCIVVGHEVYGVSDELIEMADLALEIEQFGVKQSLNVSVAFGVAVHEASLRARQFLSAG